ncbi:hypothetical protein B0A52_00769 [Exophiala mesophila]|uniref:Uncharacterized protein n=1 Tax=Exophiala mesophila TaxID=212818 RepID=A0A438NI67_EXOME|nr:hypothetical protein B0A52_00769 [Exophiala mesophila]
MPDTPTVNGAAYGSPSNAFETSSILQALEVIHNPTTHNDVRRQASDYLERLKASPDASHYGFILSTDRSQAPLVQHFGLSLLSHVIHHEIHNLSEEQSNQLRGCVLDLGAALQPSDLAFVRNKVAELWIELAKRSWALDWFDLDERLVQLWSQDLTHKTFVLTVLENLSEDVFVREDSIAILRGRDLNSAVVEIFTSSSNYAGGIKIGDSVRQMRHGDIGWLARISTFLSEVVNNQSNDKLVRELTLKAMSALRSVFIWINSSSVVHSMVLATVCNFLTKDDPEMVTGAVEALLSLYGKTRLELIEVQALVHPLIQPDSVATLRQLYINSIVTFDDVYSSRYVLSKKLSELVSLLSDHTCQYGPPTPDELDITPFLHFLTTMAEHESLIVSIPVVHSWVKILEGHAWRNSPAVASSIGPILQVASDRLIQYDQMPEDSHNPSVLFLNEEIELFPERQGFYLNYRRLCSAVIEWICYGQLEVAMQAVFKRVDELLDEVQNAEQHFSPANYDRSSEVVLRADANFALIDAAFRGFDRWQTRHKDNGASPEQGQIGDRVREASKAWMLSNMNNRTFKDPQIRQRQLKTAVEVSNRALQKDTGFAFSVLEYILSSFIIADQQHQAYTEAVIELHNYAVGELRRLALQHADYFVTFYDQLQQKFTDLIDQLGADEKLQVELKSTLFSVVQRASAVDYSQRHSKLQGFLEPIASAWKSDDLQQRLASFETFTRSQAFDKVGPYLDSLQAANIQDWTSVPYDERGAQIQQEMVFGYTILPLRETRVLLSISTEKLSQDSDLHRMITDLWSPMIHSVLEYVLRLISYNHRLHDASSWPNVGPNLLPVIKRVLRDRYWQSGISGGSMSAFHNQVKQTRSTLEGFASSVRGRIRNNLEQCYSILHTLGRLGDAFYGLPKLPDMIAEAALDTMTPLSPHHFAVVIQMVPKMIDECPPSRRQQFLTPIFSSLLRQLDTKLTEEWAKMDQRQSTKGDDENLGDEMRDDSVLRQTTYKGVNLVTYWLNTKREQQLTSKKSIVNGNYLSQDNQQSMREFLLSNTQILDRLLVFITHAIAFKDTKCAYNMLMAATRLVPDFGNDQYISGEVAEAVRGFISSDMLKTAITCLNDGYFADHQQHYAQLIATIWMSYGLPVHVPASETGPAHDRPALTSAPRDVILSLPGMTEAKVDQAAAQLLQEGSGGSGKHKKLRAIVLSLLEGVRGVRLSELGKIDMRPQQSKILEKYKQRELLGMQGLEESHHVNTDDGPDLGGVADMFGN